MKKIDVYIPAIMMLLLPFLIGEKAYINRFFEYVWSSDSYWVTDNFLLYKRNALLFFVALSGIAYFINWKQDKSYRKKHTIYGEWIVYLGLAFLSAIKSDYSTLCFCGANDQFESIWVLFAYIGCAFLTSALIRTRNERELLYCSTACMTCGMGILGVVQFLMLKQRIFLTLYNPDYVGMMMAVVLPILYMRLWEKENNNYKILYKIGTFGGVVCLLLSKSKGAIFVTVFLFICFILRKYTKERWIRFFLKCSFVLCILFFLWIVIPCNEYRNSFLSNVITEKDCVIFESRNGILKFQFQMPDRDHYLFLLSDREGRNIPYESNREGTRYHPIDERFENFEFTLANYNGTYGFLVAVDGREWYFARQENGQYGYMNGYFRIDQFQNALHVMFSGKESFATNRGYIWSRSIPLLGKTFWIGTGPDTFAAVFPQNDVGKYLLTDLPYKMIITKPHNFYLQTAIQTGILSLGAMIFGFFRVLKMLFTYKNQSEAYMIAFSLCAYLATGMVYDSNLCVSPVFCLLFGAGVSIIKEIESLN